MFFFLLSFSFSSIFFSSFVYTYPNLETHFGFASISVDESRLDQRLDAVVNRDRYVEVVGGSKEKEKEKEMGFTVEEANNTRKALFDVAGASWTLVASFWRPLQMLNFILFPAHLSVSLLWDTVEPRVRSSRHFVRLFGTYTEWRYTGWKRCEGGFLRGKDATRDTFSDPLALPCLGFDLLLLPSRHPVHENGRRILNENVSILRDERIDVLIPWRGKPPSFSSFHSELFPMEILSPLSGFNRGYVFMLFSSIKRNQFLLFFWSI